MEDPQKAQLATLSSLVVAYLLHVHKYSPNCTFVWIVQFALCLRTWMSPVPKEWILADRLWILVTAAVTYFAYSERGLSNSTFIGLLVVCALFRLADARTKRGDQVTGYYLLWHGSVLLTNAAVMIHLS